MTFTAQDLFELLPVVHRLRDFEQGEPLRALLEVMGEQVRVTQGDLERLFHNWFIETCDDWVVPYLGDLVGFRREGITETDTRLDTTVADQRARFLFPRREVANTIRFRRRKGTLAVLEELAFDAAEWPARVVEFAKLMVWAQSVRYPQPALGRTVDVRDRDALHRIDGPFDSVAHLPDVRHIADALAPGRYHPSHVGLFVWRHRSYSVRRSRAKCLKRTGGWRVFSIDPVGLSIPLYIQPQREESPTSIAQEEHVPAPLRLWALREQEPTTVAGQPPRVIASERLYGHGRSLTLWREVKPKSKGRDGSENAPELRFVRRRQILPADLGWFVRGQNPPRTLTDQVLARRDNRIAVDPERGLIMARAARLRVTYQYGFSADMGGGPYVRLLPPPKPTETLVAVSEEFTLQHVLTEIGHRHFQVSDGDYQPQSDHLILELVDNGQHALQKVGIRLRENQTLEIRAANGRRPVINLNRANCRGGLQIQMANKSRLVLDGLVICGNGLEIHGPSDEHFGPLPFGQVRPRVEIRHSTLVPGGFPPECFGGSRPSLELDIPGGCVAIQSSIIGQVVQAIRRQEDGLDSDGDADTVLSESLRLPTQLEIADSIVDGHLGEAINGIDEFYLTAARATFFGKVHVAALVSGQDCIFRDLVCVRRREEGGLRFCYLPEKSQTPQRYYCQPDLARQRRTELDPNNPDRCGDEKSTIAKICGQDLPEIVPTDPDFLEPSFVSTQYGQPGYAQLSLNCTPEISRGAEDESEMGVFHDLYQPQRKANLQARLEEFTPVTMESAIIFAT